MAYSKQTWDTNSVFNPTRMNHIEDGIASVDEKYARSTVTIGNENITSGNDYVWELALSKTGYSPIGVLGAQQRGSRGFYYLDLYIDLSTNKLMCAVHCTQNTNGARYDVQILWEKNT